VCRTEERYGHSRVHHFSQFPGAVERCAQRRTIIAGCRLHVDIIKQAGTYEFTVRGTIKRDSAGKSQLPQPGGRTKMAAYMQDYPVKTFLQRRRNIAVCVGDLFLKSSFFDQFFRQIPARTQIVLSFFTGPIYAQCWDAHRAIGSQLDSLFEETLETIRITVRCKPHNLIFVRVEIEA
jgi:hypothetical protein